MSSCVVVASDDAATSSASSADDEGAHSVTATRTTTLQVKGISGGDKVQPPTKIAAAMTAVAAPGDLEAESEPRVTSFMASSRCPRLS